MRPAPRLIALVLLCAALTVLALAMVDSALPVAAIWAFLALVVMFDALASIGPRAISVEVSLPKTGMVGVDAPYTLMLKRKAGAGLPATLSLRFDLDTALGTGMLVDIACDGPTCVIKDHLPLLKRGLHKVHALHLKWPSRWGLLEVLSRRPLAREVTVVPDVTAVMAGQIQAQMLPLLEGQKDMRLKGAGSEFHQLRDFARGMDSRHNLARFALMWHPRL